MDELWVTGRPGGHGRADLLQISPDPAVHAPRARLRVSGELDLVTAGQFWARIRSLLEAPADVGDRIVELELDLTDVPFCDVTGFNVLLNLDRVMRDRGGELIIQHPCRPLLIMAEAMDGLTRLQFA